MSSKSLGLLKAISSINPSPMKTPGVPGEIVHPGSRGGKWYWGKDESGRPVIRYGTPPNGAKEIHPRELTHQQKKLSMKEENEQAKLDEADIVNKPWNESAINDSSDPGAALQLSRDLSPKTEYIPFRQNLKEYARNLNHQIVRVLNSGFPLNPDDHRALKTILDKLYYAWSEHPGFSGKARADVPALSWAAAAIMHHAKVPLPRYNPPVPKSAFSALHGTDTYALGAILRFGWIPNDSRYDLGTGVYFKLNDPNLDHLEQNKNQTVRGVMDRYGTQAAWDDKKSNMVRYGEHLPDYLQGEETNPAFVEVRIQPDAKILDLRNEKPGIIRTKDGREILAQYANDWEKYAKHPDNDYAAVIARAYDFNGSWTGVRDEGVQCVVYKPGLLSISGWGSDLSEDGKIIVKSLKNKKRPPNGAIFNPSTMSLVMPNYTLARSYPIKPKEKVSGEVEADERSST